MTRLLCVGCEACKVLSVPDAMLRSCCCLQAGGDSTSSNSDASSVDASSKDAQAAAADGASDASLSGLEITAESVFGDPEQLESATETQVWKPANSYLCSICEFCMLCRCEFSQTADMSEDRLLSTAA